MREALRALTTRGRAFVAAGATATACAVVLGQVGLVRVGVLVAVLPLLAAWVVGRGRYRLALVRRVSPARVVAGQPARVELDLTNEGRDPRGTLLLEEQVPWTLGSRPRFVLEGVRPGWRRTVSYGVRSEVRGRFEVGPMTVRVRDPFGLVELGRTFRSTSPLVVVPRTVPLPAVPLGGGWDGAGDDRPRSFATGSAEDLTVRDYRHGDDLRRVHWRSSARTGELMVRSEEQPWQTRVTVLLDDRSRSHRGVGAGSSLETAVSVAASVAVHLLERGYGVRLVTAAGDDPALLGVPRGARPPVTAATVLESLAVLPPQPRRDLDLDWLGSGAPGGLLVAVLGEVDPADSALLRRVRGHAGTALALALDVEAIASGERRPPRTGADLLRAHGWRATPLGPGDDVAAAWRDLARTRASSGAPAGAGR